MIATAAILVISFGLPVLTGFDTGSRAPEPGRPPVPPLHGYLDVKLVGPGTVASVLLGLLGWWWFAPRVELWSWRRLLVVCYLLGLGWLIALALVDPDGLSRSLATPTEYLPTARGIDDVSTLLHDYVSRIPAAAPDRFDTHVAGHPPGAILFFVLLVRVGLGGDLAAGLVVTALAASAVLATLDTLRSLGAETLARRAAPLLVLGPSAMLMAVSADAVFTVVTCWGLACLARGTRASPRWWPWSGLAGLLLGLAVLMSYGLPLIGLVALAVLAAGRSWRPLPIAALAALTVVLGFAALGFAWWEAYPAVTARYWSGVAGHRSGLYWTLGNLGALLAGCGPLLGVSVALAVRRRDLIRAPDADPERAVVLLVLGAATAVLLADLSQMSRSEVERIWLPFVPWLALGLALLPVRCRRWALAVQISAAIVVQQLVWTTW